MDDEDVLDADIRICDPHHHLWEYPGSVYLIDELKADTAGLNVEHSVFVECGSAYRTDGSEAMRPVGETAWVHDLSPDGFVAGIVGFADLSLGDAIEEVLNAHIQAGGGRFRGIRHASAWDASPEIRPSHTSPPPDLFGLPGFRKGFAALGRAGLHFEAWLYFPQLPQLIEVADANPDVPIVLDHLGGPLGIGPYRDRREEVLSEWRSSMSEVAQRENIVLKLGGIGMPIYGMDWHHRSAPPTSEEVAEVWGPPIRWCIEEFGPERCMFESNFPVDRVSCGYKTLWNSFVRMTSDLSQGERDALFATTAERVYRLT